MTFQINALPMAPFAHLFDLPETELVRHKARRMVADTVPGFPCRVGLRDVPAGTEVVLVNFDHLDAASPYAARHAIFVSKDAVQARPDPGEVPAVLSSRHLSVRVFDADDMMWDARIVQGINLAATLDQLFADPRTQFVDTHFAARGCFGARVTRA